MKKIFVRSRQSISLQPPLCDEGIWTPVTYHTPQVRCMDPSFGDFIPPMTARRMSPIIKRAVTTSLCCVKESGIESPDAIIMGTGLGCIDDTEKFLRRMIEDDEQFLQPTAFIQSTHNTISSQVAIRLHCHSFNNTHVHKGISFESALFESWLLFQANEIHTALVGGHDEMTPLCFDIFGHLGCWREEVDDTLHILSHPSHGTFAGEGATCFMLADEKGDTPSVIIEDMEVGHGVADDPSLVLSFLSRSGYDTTDIDVLFTGRDGDTANDTIYEDMTSSLHLKEACYKNLCGEYRTAPAYGLFAACACMEAGRIPAHLAYDRHEIAGVRCALLFHHWQNNDYSLILLSSCGD